MTDTLPWYWIVFNEPVSEGGKFLGCVILQSCCAEDAPVRAAAMGCDPGGEPLIGRFRDEIATVPLKYRNRLLSQREFRELRPSALPPSADDNNVRSLLSLAK